MSSRSLNTTVNVEPRDKEKYLACLLKLSKIFDVVQSDDFNMKDKKQEKLRDKLLDEVQKLYNEVGLNSFSATLFRMMIVPFQTKDNPYILKIIDFFYALICDPKWGDGTQTNNSPNDTINTMNGSMIDDGSTEILPMRILRLCERYHSDSRAIVRLRIMQTVGKIIPERIAVMEITKNQQIKYIRMLINRMKDKSDQVRVVSARIMCEFMGDDVPFQVNVLDALIDGMKYDPEPMVRTKIVSCIKITDDTMEHVVERTGDPSTLVRAAAINRVSESIKLASLTVEMREAILKANVTENSPKNIDKAVSSLLESWLRCLEDDLCEFLRVLNVRKRAKLCWAALNSLFSQPAEEAFEKMSSPLLNEKRYPEESLCIESTYLWLYMFKRFKDEPYVYNKLSLPVNEMIDYIVEYVEVVEEEGDLPEGDLDYRSWMLGDMLQILHFLPVEEGERKAILEFLPALCLKKKLMDERNSALVVQLISVCSNLEDETNVIDLVNCLLDSDRPTVRKSNASSNMASASTLKEGQENDGSPTQLMIELGNLMHRKKKLERDQDLAIKENNLLEAHEFQEEINVLEGHILKVKEQIKEHESNSGTTDANETMEEEEQWTYSNRTMRIVLTIVKTNILFLDKISDFSRTFCEMYALKALEKSKDPSIRALALELMCIISLEFEEECPRTALFCLMALLRDSMNVKVTALKCLYDLVLRYSFAKLGGFQEVQGVLMGTANNAIKDMSRVVLNADDPASTLKSLLLSYIRHDDVKLVKISVAGVLKLLFKKEMNSSRLITTFLMNWAIPSQDAQIRFKEVGTMIPVYASIGENEAVEVAQCLISCIKKTLMKIHSRSQMYDQTPHPDIDKITSFIVKCTDPVSLQKFQRCYIAHEAIANGALQELRDSDLITEEKIHYTKLLKVLDLRQCPSGSINQMIHTLSEIAETSNRTIAQTLKGFQTYLESLIENNSTAENGDDDTMQPHTIGAFDNDSGNE